MTYLEEECSYRRAEEEEEIQRRVLVLPPAFVMQIFSLPDPWEYFFRGEDPAGPCQGVVHDRPTIGWGVRRTLSCRILRYAGHQGLTLVHFSAQPEPFLSLKSPNVLLAPSPSLP